MDPASVTADLINAVEDIVCDGMDTLEVALVSQLRGKKKQVHQGVEKLQTFLDAAMDKNFAAFEKESVALLASADGGDEKESVTEEDLEALNEGISALQRKIRNLRYVRNSLRNEAAEVREQVAECKSLIPKLEGLASVSRDRVKSVMESSRKYLDMSAQLVKAIKSKQ